MDSTAIREIANMAEIKQPDTFVPVSVLRSDASIHNLEKYHENRSRFRGELNTPNIGSFCEYTNSKSAANVFIDTDNMNAEAIFNLGDEETPGHGDNTAVLSLTKTAAYRTMQQIDGAERSQRNMVDWIIDWREMLTPIDANGEEDGTIKTAISAISKFTVSDKSTSEHSEVNHRSSRSAFEEIDVSSEDNIPAGFKFRFVPYLGLEPRDFFLRLSILAFRTEKPQLKLSIIMHEAEQEKMAEEFKGKLTEELTDNIDVLIGNFHLSK